jgi:hypothetical protein
MDLEDPISTNKAAHSTVIPAMASPKMGGLWYRLAWEKRETLSPN